MRRATQTIDEVELDLGRYELRRSGRRVKLDRRTMDLLIFLVSRREQLVTRDDIVAKLWRTGLFIDTDRNINNIVRQIRAALGDDAARPRFLETVIGKGYRFVGPVRVIDNRDATSALGHEVLGAVASERAGAASDRASLAVLPLLLIGSVEEDNGVCLGFADALVSRLGNLPGFVVLPTSAVLNLPSEAPPAEVASRLSVRFVVHGALQASKGVWRLSLEMFDAALQAACLRTKRDIDLSHLPALEDEIAKQIAAALHLPLDRAAVEQPPRYSKDALAYAEYMRGYRLSSSGDPALLDNATKHLINAVTRDPAFSLGHAALSLVCATRHFELEPATVWLEKAEFHCRRALELNPNLPEAHVAFAFLQWGPSKNFQHLEAIGALKRALSLQKNLPHAYNRLGTILAHIGLLDHARLMYERGRPFHSRKELSHSIVQVYVWKQEYELAVREIEAWRAENPSNKYPAYFAPQPAMMTGDWKQAESLLDEAVQLMPDEPLILSLQGVFYALTGREKAALASVSQACANPKSFGHAHHTYYQIACVLSLLGQTHAAFEWLERSVSSGFACWPFFLKDPFLQNVHSLPEFEILVSSLQAKYPDHLGLL